MATTVGEGQHVSSEKRIALFYKGCPYPAQSGLQRRVLEIISGFSELGCQLNLSPTNQFTETPWTTESISWLNGHGVAKVEVYESRRIDYLCQKLSTKFAKVRGQPIHPFSLYHSPLGMRQWLARHLRTFRPDATVMVYAIWDRLLTGSRSVAGIRIIDTIDLTTKNARMQRALEREVKVTSDGYERFSDTSLNDNYYEKLDVTAETREFAIYDRYDYTLAISQSEAETIRQRTHKTKVIYLPMTEKERSIENFYDGPALFTISDNLFNRQACHYFARRILPLILSREPHFELEITGSLRPSLVPQKGIRQLGYLPDLKDSYTHARFFICPVFGGTGQLVKVVEAMAAGLAVIVLESSLHRTPISHGINGLVARDAHEFSEQTIKLWQDRDLCQRLGTAARETVKQNFSHERLLNTLSTLLSAP
jgi:glycosyltransferase involved in cell wall biosynthesis